MTDDKLRRLHLSGAGHELQGIHGDFYLAPVDEYVPVKREVWERVVRALNAVHRWDMGAFEISKQQGMKLAEELAHRALAEIEGVEGE